MSIEGMPDGWELVRIGKPKVGEHYLFTKLDHKTIGVSVRVEAEVLSTHPPYVIVRKIEKPKRYRAFANAEEFKPHRSRWWREKTSASGNYHLCSFYNDSGFHGYTWQEAFDNQEFEDGTPFGVEVSE